MSNNYYITISDEIINCILTKIVVKENFLVMLFSDPYNGSVLFSITKNKNRLTDYVWQEYIEKLCSYMYQKKVSTVHKLIVNPTYRCYHVWEWDNYYRGECDSSFVGMIERDNTGTPKLYDENSTITLYSERNGKTQPNATEIFLNKYISQNHPYLDHYLLIPPTYNRGIHFPTICEFTI